MKREGTVIFLFSSFAEFTVFIVICIAISVFHIFVKRHCERKFKI